MGFVLKEHRKAKLLCFDEPDADYGFDKENNTLKLSWTDFNLFNNLKSKQFRKDHFCFKVYRAEKEIHIEADYFIGLDWLVTGLRYIQVEPKLNTATNACFENQLEIDGSNQEEINSQDLVSESSILTNTAYNEINYLQMLLDVMSDDIVAKECNDLVQIGWQELPIPINHKQDKLTPFLVIQFLQLLKLIVKKGLKKSYYKIQESLTNRVKGKILVGQQIKQNIFKNRMNKTVCEYQVFGLDNPENRFLKKVLKFVTAYIENNSEIFKNSKIAIEQTVNYCRPAFEEIGNELPERLRFIKHNPFFKEYKEGLRIGDYILKRFGYNVVKATNEIVDTPPFWIDMPRLFELYVYQKLLNANERNKSKINYQFSTYGNALDILIKDGKNSMVIDAKYKLHYRHGQIHQDIRQVAGYARLNKVLDYLEKNNIEFERKDVLPCLIIYPDIENGLDLTEGLGGLVIESLIKEKKEIKAYHKVYKLSVSLPRNE